MESFKEFEIKNNEEENNKKFDILLDGILSSNKDFYNIKNKEDELN